jgi:hypothetical protein
MKTYLVTIEAFGTMRFCRVKAENPEAAKAKAIHHWNVKLEAKEQA